MQPGDLISLGSFSPLLPPKAGLSVTANFEGLPGRRAGAGELQVGVCAQDRNPHFVF
jgi:hypothetical protein